ncbi:DUF5988 family protein [Kitasatospora sp. NPDC057223]|uniref:DUF5988 family protein n=1 Tax=Kitasatospora sp. NPDC057223 TaxID=3346055 RepID=UPI00362FFA0D
MTNPSSGRQANVLLRGGPHSDGQVAVRDLTEVLKLPMGSHYEHYGPTREQVSVAGRELTVFEWSHRTYVAE